MKTKTAGILAAGALATVFTGCVSIHAPIQFSNNADQCIDNTMDLAAIKTFEQGRTEMNVQEDLFSMVKGFCEQQYGKADYFKDVKSAEYKNINMNAAIKYNR